VRHAEIGGARVVLDLRTESYRVLDEVATAMWRVLTGEEDRDEALDALAAAYDVDRARLEADLESFARTCVDEGLLAPAGAADEQPAAPASAAAAKPRRASTRAALASLLATRRALDRDGFRATYERYAALPAGDDPKRAAAALATFQRAENLFVAGRAPNDCLVRSLGLFRFLRSSGVPAEHVIGVTRFPFQVHAWVELDGTAVLDARSREFDFSPLARLT
jgi:hypothetical protein